MGYSPLFRQKLQDRGITNVQDAIFEKDNVYVISCGDRDISFIEKLRDGAEGKIVDRIEGYNGFVYDVYQYQIVE